MLPISDVNRKYMFFQNTSTDNLWIDFSVDAVPNSPSIKLLPDAEFVMQLSFVSTEFVTFFGAKTGQTYTAREG